MDNDNARLRLTLDLLLCMVGLWLSLPEHRKRGMLMKLMTQGSRLTQWLAARTAKFAIRRELAGDTDAAEAGYGMTYDLMVGPYRFVTEWYEKLRSA